MSGKICPKCSRFTLFKTSEYTDDRKCTSCGYWPGKPVIGLPREQFIEEYIETQVSERISKINESKKYIAHGEIEFTFKLASLKALALSGFFQRISIEEIRKNSKGSLEAKFIKEAMEEILKSLK